MSLLRGGEVISLFSIMAKPDLCEMSLGKLPLLEVFTPDGNISIELTLCINRNPISGIVFQTHTRFGLSECQESGRINGGGFSNSIPLFSV